jgi:PEP-CTERM motif
MLKKLSVLLWGMFLASACLLATGSPARGDETIYGNNASYGPDTVYQIDLNTGAITNQYVVSSGNGRGVVVVGDIMYTTNADSNNVYAFDLSTDTSLGVQFTVTGAGALSTMAYDGTNFWIGDYSGTGKVYEYTPTGTLLNTISLSQCAGNCDGLEYIAANGGELVSNRGDANGPYDLYSLTGTLLTSDFLDPTTACGNEESTGIAFDGTDFIVSCIFESKLGIYDANGNFIDDVTIGPGGTSSAGTLVEDLSANYATVLGTPTPEPSSLASLALGLIALGALTMWRKRLGVAAE